MGEVNILKLTGTKSRLSAPKCLIESCLLGFCWLLVGFLLFVFSGGFCCCLLLGFCFAFGFFVFDFCGVFWSVCFLRHLESIAQLGPRKTYKYFKSFNCYLPVCVWFSWAFPNATCPVHKGQALLDKLPGLWVEQVSFQIYVSFSMWVICQLILLVDGIQIYFSIVTLMLWRRRVPIVQIKKE